MTFNLGFTNKNPALSRIVKLNGLPSLIPDYDSFQQPYYDDGKVVAYRKTLSRVISRRGRPVDSTTNPEDLGIPVTDDPFSCISLSNKLSIVLSCKKRDYCTDKSTSLHGTIERVFL